MRRKTFTVSPGRRVRDIWIDGHFHGFQQIAHRLRPLFQNHDGLEFSMPEAGLDYIMPFDLFQGNRAHYH